MLARFAHLDDWPVWLYYPVVYGIMVLIFKLVWLAGQQDTDAKRKLDNVRRARTRVREHLAKQRPAA